MRKLLAGLLIFIFIPIFFVVLFTFNLQSILLNKEEVKDSLVRTGFYEQLIPSVIGDLFDSGAKIELVTSDELTQLINNTLPPETIQFEFEKTIDQAYPYLLSETDSFTIKYDLIDYKKTFLKEAEALLLAEVKSLPKCTKKQLSKLNLNDSSGLPTCKPPGFSDNEILEGVVNGDFDELLVEIPNEIVITEAEITSKPANMEINSQEPPRETLKDTRDTLAQRNTVLLAGFGTLIAILILIILLRLGSIKSMSKWVGWALLLASINFIIISFLLYYSTSLTQQAVEPLGESAGLASATINDLLQRMFFSRALPEFIIITIISLGLIIGPHFVKPKENLQPTT